MIVTRPLLELSAIAQVILDPTASPGACKQACDAFYHHGLNHLPPLLECDSQLGVGRALAPSHAARCVQDFVRTARLTQAVAAAIECRRRQRPGQPVQVLYAGCGPLAPLALLPALKAGADLRFWLIDIHPQSLDGARHLFAHAGMADRIAECWCADATTVRLPGSLRPDILVVETMQRALDHEPQLAVVANLAGQCAADAILVPDEVEVTAWLADPGRELGADAGPRRIELGSLLTVSKATLPQWRPLLEAGAVALPPRVLRVPDATPAGLALMLRTRIDAGWGLSFADYDAGLTYPRFEFALGAIQPGERLVLQYRLGANPGFTVGRGDIIAPG